jgi:ribosomal protein L37AE/L43A
MSTTYERRCGHVCETSSPIRGKSLLYAAMQPCPACLAARVSHAKPVCQHCGRAQESTNILRCDHCGADLTSTIQGD